MRVYIFILAFFIILFPPTPTVLINKESRILLIGDSLAFGLKKLLYQKAKQENIFLKSDARGGTTLAQWINLNWAKKNIEKHSPTIIIVSLGINDYCVIANKNKIKEHAEKLINLAAQKNIKVVWLIPAVKKKSSQYIYDSVKDSGAIIFDARKL